MATRREVNQQKIALGEALRQQYREGVLQPGEAAPSLRQLASEFGISTRVANGVVQELVNEGLFHQVPRVGTFVGHGHADCEFYLMLLPTNSGLTSREELMQIQHGFEETIAERGGASLVMPLQRALDCRKNGELPPIVGLFDLSYFPDEAQSWGRDEALRARVGFSGRLEDATADEISYDDEHGGRLAARHLVELGHRNIAFLGLHASDEPAGELIWSRERAQGWKQTLHARGLPTATRLFLPRRAPQHDAHEHSHVGRELGQQILANREITAVVAANDYAATGLIEAARELGLPTRNWPSIVGFDNHATANGHLLTSMRRPAEAMGRAAAQLLWERRHQLLPATPVHRRVPMRLIARLSSRRDGTGLENSALLATFENTALAA